METSTRNNLRLVTLINRGGCWDAILFLINFVEIFKFLNPKSLFLKIYKQTPNQQNICIRGTTLRLHTILEVPSGSERSVDVWGSPGPTAAAGHTLRKGKTSLQTVVREQ